MDSTSSTTSPPLHHNPNPITSKPVVNQTKEISYSTSSALPETLPLTKRLKSFESSVGLSRKAFRLGKFVPDVNVLRAAKFDSKEEIMLSIIAYGGEGLYYFVEQFVWLSALISTHKNWISC